MSFAVNGVTTTTTALDPTDHSPSPKITTKPTDQQELRVPPKPTAEEQIHRLTLEGQSAKQIADVLGLSETQVLAALGSESTSAAAATLSQGISVDA
jgi:DNA-binding NarL/FixJ family response regulator